MTGETGAGIPRPVPVNSVSVGAETGTPAPTKPAMLPLLPRFAHKVDVHAIITGGVLTIVARDVLEAIGRETGQYSTDPSHDRDGSHDWKYSDHAAARTWPHALVIDIVSPLAEYDELADRFLRWLDDRIGELIVLGLDTVERRTLFGTGHKPAADAVEAEAPTGPAFYSVAAVARILSRDPGIGVIGRDALFEHLNKTAWIDRVGNSWRPVRELLLIGYLVRQDVNVPQYSDNEPYPQVCITPLGIEALHQRLGGTAALDLNRSHRTLI